MQTLTTEPQNRNKIEICCTKTATKMGMKLKQGMENVINKFLKHKQIGKYKVTVKEGQVEIADQMLPRVHGDLQKGQRPLLSSEPPMLLDFAHHPLAASVWDLKLEGQRVFLMASCRRPVSYAVTRTAPLSMRKCCVTAKLWQMLAFLFSRSLSRNQRIETLPLVNQQCFPAPSDSLGRRCSESGEGKSIILDYKNSCPFCIFMYNFNLNWVRPNAQI